MAFIYMIGKYKRRPYSLVTLCNQYKTYTVGRGLPSQIKVMAMLPSNTLVSQGALSVYFPDSIFTQHSMPHHNM